MNETTLSNSELRLAIAAALGWREIHTDSSGCLIGSIADGVTTNGPDVVPNWCASIEDSMALERLLDSRGKFMEYLSNLRRAVGATEFDPIDGLLRLINAPARKRSEAALATLRRASAKLDFSQTSLANVEQVIGGRLAP